MDGEIGHVSDTALMIAAYRARESARPDALFRDPLAETLAGEKGKAIAAAHPRGEVTAWMTAIRTRIIDRFIMDRVAQGYDTVLNLGAGLDTRPYRLQVPESLHWIEADFPDVIAAKERAIAGEKPVCRLERVGLDLADEGQRRAFLSGLQSPAGKILVLTEGVIPYLDEKEAGALAADLFSQHRVGAWILDYFASQAVRLRGRAMRHRMRNAPFRFAPGDWHGFFAAHGWMAAEFRSLTDEADEVRRPIPLPLPVRLLFLGKFLFMSPAARAEARRFAGYAVMEPRRT